MSPNLICVDLSHYEDFDVNDEDQILEVLNENIEITRDAIDFSVIDDRGSRHEDTESFTGIDHVGDRVLARWSFDWSVYSPCQDHCFDGISEGSAEIWIRNTKLLLKSFIYPEKPSTFDEL
ncbi:hypothetical protein [Marinagarivorans cellulosilyticus]|uniref:Uncharacterized protein n=1 Tax=Marinagarivorans cellulosilyticus TaxID=2721545 RepID=A0AAN2BK74_9GAMM|nr:hypothetical protein [Marinagarivorans cellulosilyticus]BCD97695.1 hypothetical protein MARGE09_P1896 [Marinagarivorans cellulosilyticus]